MIFYYCKMKTVDCVIFECARIERIVRGLAYVIWRHYTWRCCKKHSSCDGMNVSFFKRNISSRELNYANDMVLLGFRFWALINWLCICVYGLYIIVGASLHGYLLQCWWNKQTYTVNFNVFISLNVNVYVNSLISLWVHQTSQFTPLILELFLIRSHLPGEIQCIFCS